MLGVERRTITTNSYVYLIINNKDNNDRCCKSQEKRIMLFFCVAHLSLLMVPIVWDLGPKV
jgi:hypothetical protein